MSGREGAQVENQKKLKVLMIGPDRSVHGGISGVVNNYYEAGLDKKIDLCYIGTMVEGSKLCKLLQAVKAFFLFCIKLPGYDIVHVNMASDSSYYRKSFFIKAAKFAGRKIVIHQHGGDFATFYYKEHGERGRKKIDKVLSMGDAFLVLAPVWKEFFGQMTAEDKITVLPDSIMIPDQVQKEYGQHKILFLGRLCREKGIGELLEVMPDLRKKYPETELYLGGIWEDKGLKAEAEKYPEFVTWLGWVSGEEKKKYLQMCDIFVLPSYFEGQSVSLLEAMAYSCAITASETGGIPQMITDKDTGLLVAPKDAASLERGLESLLADAELCRRLGERARKKVSEEFSIENNMEQLLMIYRKVSGLS